LISVDKEIVGTCDSLRAITSSDKAEVEDEQEATKYNAVYTEGDKGSGS
jgi:hypothetical protein